MTVADLLSLLRIPLGAGFVVVASHRTAALALIAIAALSDVLDGWVARRTRRPDGPQRHHGEWLDPLCDKLFVGAMVLGLMLAYRPHPALVAVLLTREWLQLIAVIVYQAGRGLHRVQPYNFRAGRMGKATTVIQFACAAAILAGWREPWPLAVAAGISGLVSFVIYARRAKTAHATSGPEPSVGSIG